MQLDLSATEQYCSEPSPLDRVRRAYDDLSEGQTLEVRSSIREHVWAVRMWSQKHGIVILVDDTDAGLNRLILKRGPRAAPAS